MKSQRNRLKLTLAAIPALLMIGASLLLLSACVHDDETHATRTPPPPRPSPSSTIEPTWVSPIHTPQPTATRDHHDDDHEARTTPTPDGDDDHRVDGNVGRFDDGGDDDRGGGDGGDDDDDDDD